MSQEKRSSLVCWSGGCDSTLLLLDKAKESTASSPVRAISIVHDQVGANDEQRQARMELLKIFKKRGYHIKYSETVIKHPKKNQFFGVPGGHSSLQPLMWLSTAIIYLEQNQDLYFGYVRGDDIWHNKQLFCNAFDSLKILCNKTESWIYFPLEWHSKADVIQRIRDEKLISKVWWCEEPKKGKQCGKCTPCISYKFALSEMEIREKNKSKPSLAKKEGKKATKKKTKKKKR